MSRDDEVTRRSAENRMSSEHKGGWRYSKSSVSSIYHSAQDITDLLSDDEFHEPYSSSPHRSYHSVRDSLNDIERDDIFSSPQGSPIFPGKKVPKFIILLLCARHMERV